MIPPLLNMVYINYILSFISTIILILLSIAFFTLLERKILGYTHLRKGPNKVRLSGLLQPISDAIKLFLKQILHPNISNKKSFIYIPCLILFLSLRLWLLYPYPTNPISFKYLIIIFLCIRSVNVYSSLLAGWLRNSKYSLIGALRSSAQTISYEVSITIIVIRPIFITSSFDIKSFYKLDLIFILLPITIFLWFISIIAETNRTPFDLSEGESELVSGFNTEYRAGSFAIIFIAEYINILFISLLTSFILIRLYLKQEILTQFILISFTLSFSVLFIWTRASEPRIRYDHLINLCWKVFLPVSISTLIITIIITHLILLVSF